MRIKFELNVKNIFFLVIIIVCILALSYGIYYQVVIKKQKEEEERLKQPVVAQDMDFDDIFDNKLHLQNYNNANFVNKMEQTKDIVYTTYTFNEIFEGKYEINASIPIININNENAINIDKEITSVFYDKINSIVDRK